MRSSLPLVFAASLLMLPACGSKAPPGPAGADAFIKDYQAAYEAGQREAILMTVDWPSVDEELREYTKLEVFPHQGTRPIRSIEQMPYEATGSDTREHEAQTIVPSPTPTHRVVIIFEPEHRNASPERHEVLLVEDEGVVKLCGWAFEE